MISRRAWLGSALAGIAVIAARGSAAQQAPAMADTSNLFAGMDPTRSRSVRLPRKPGALPSMSADERDALEHRLKCQCGGCTLDVYTCRTTDFSCQVSPAMHRDVLGLVEGGYSAQEILDAFVNSYGDRALMAPPKVGFNILGYIVPSIVLALGAVILAVVIRRWNRSAAMAGASPHRPRLDGTPDEIARLEAALRDDS